MTDASTKVYAETGRYARPNAWWKEYGFTSNPKDFNYTPSRLAWQGDNMKYKICDICEEQTINNSKFETQCDETGYIDKFIVCEGCEKENNTYKIWEGEKVS